MTLVMSLAALGLGTLIALFIGRGISRPVITMTQAMGALAGGDQSVEIPAQSRRDEIGEMAKAVQVFKVNAVEMKRLEAEQVAQRSEEHTSELKSLMRISYAVFCLKKTIKQRKPANT